MCDTENPKSDEQLAASMASEIMYANMHCKDNTQTIYVHKNYLRCLLRKYNQCVNCNERRLVTIYNLACNKFKGWVNPVCNWYTHGLFDTDTNINCYNQEEGEAFGKPDLARRFKEEDTNKFVEDRFVNAAITFNEECNKRTCIQQEHFDKLRCAKSLVIQACEGDVSCEENIFTKQGVLNKCVPEHRRSNMNIQHIRVFNPNRQHYCSEIVGYFKTQDQIVEPPSITIDIRNGFRGKIQSRNKRSLEKHDSSTELVKENVSNNNIIEIPSEQNSFKKIYNAVVSHSRKENSNADFSSNVSSSLNDYQYTFEIFNYAVLVLFICVVAYLITKCPPEKFLTKKYCIGFFLCLIGILVCLALIK
ncbi:uncharacterized protein VNE69_11063 [Vairimorpha necatrix]|uniref:Uncharacterized protein n=1 Tax=Vairimorpha necatrix TaxID=6039 RepID=A0AAX4JG12_9MICR